MVSKTGTDFKMLKLTTDLPHTARNVESLPCLLKDIDCIFRQRRITVPWDEIRFRLEHTTGLFGLKIGANAVVISGHVEFDHIQVFAAAEWTRCWLEVGRKSDLLHEMVVALNNHFFIRQYLTPKSWCFLFSAS